MDDVAQDGEPGGMACNGPAYIVCDAVLICACGSFYEVF